MPSYMAMFPHDAAASGGDAASPAARANQACYSCRKQKRRCDKALPACGLCSRMSRHCDYSEIPASPTPEELATLVNKVRELEARLNYAGASDVSMSLSPQGGAISRSRNTPPISSQHEPLWQGGPSNFPPAALLDSHMFQWIGVQIPRPTAEIPVDMLQCIGTAEDLEQTLSDYFSDIHPWFPIAYHKRFAAGFQLWETSSDIAFLILAMKLITSQPQRGYGASENYLYTACKRYAASLESTGTTSIHYLQAIVLVALYEYGQSVYPAAYMTVGQCIQYAELLGLPFCEASSVTLGLPMTWADTEERNRVWWAVYILDKLVSLGSYKRPMCPEPAPDGLLPADDKAWDLDDRTRAIQRPISSDPAEAHSPFARLCQTAQLASRVLHHHAEVERCRLRGDRYPFPETGSLVERAYAICHAARDASAADPTAYFPLVAACCLDFFALFRLLALYSGCGGGNMLRGVAGGSEWNEDELAFQLSAQDGLRKTAAYLLDLVADFSASVALDEDVVKAPPLVLDAFYQACVVYHECWKENGDPLAEIRLDTIRKCLVRLSGRWRLGKEFLDMLDTRHMNFMGSTLSASRLGGIPIVVPAMN